MDIKEVKQLINNSTAVLVLDNGEPSFVVLGYGMYRDLVSSKAGEKEVKINPVRSLTRASSASPEDLGEPHMKQDAEHVRDFVRGEAISYGINPIHNGAVVNSYNQHEKESEILERLNKEILALKTQIEMEEKSLNNQG